MKKKSDQPEDKIKTENNIIINMCYQISNPENEIIKGILGMINLRTQNTVTKEAIANCKIASTLILPFFK